MKVHQLVHTLNYGDAISGEAISIKRLLQEDGVDGQIYALNAHEKVKHLVRKAAHFEKDLQGELNSGEEVTVVLHYSIASPLNQLFEQCSGAYRAMIYHNLTPPHWYYGYNARVVEDLRVGRAELPELAKCADLALADSEYNRSELVELGCEDAQVLPLVLDQKKWQVSANSGIERVLKGHGGRNFLHVGRFAPNKCVEDIIKAFYFYHHKIDKQSRLWLVGSDVDTEIYSFELRRLRAELGLDEAVNFVGSVADSELRAFYENADIYLCMSEHEGFCVPLLEAMHFGVPVIAYASTAIPATLGAAGLLLKRKSPAEVAELMHLLLTDAGVRGELVAAGKARVSEFSESVFKEKLYSTLINRTGKSVEKKAVKA